MKEVFKVIKYGNRKLYYPLEQRYVRADELCGWVLKNIDVTVVDHKTKNDITAQVLLGYLPKHLAGLEKDKVISLMKFGKAA